MAKKKKKKSTRKSTTRKKTARKTTAGKTKSRKSAGLSSSSKSVDGILSKFEKERSTQESTLGALRKKIEGLEKKSSAMQEQIAKLSDQESQTVEAIAQMDSRRDAEVSDLLAKLGVNVRFPASSSLIENSSESNLSAQEAKQPENEMNAAVASSGDESGSDD